MNAQHILREVIANKIGQLTLANAELTAQNAALAQQQSQHVQRIKELEDEVAKLKSSGQEAGDAGTAPSRVTG